MPGEKDLKMKAEIEKVPTVLLNMLKNKLYLASLRECNEKCLFCVRGGEARPIRYLDTKKCKEMIAKAAQEGWGSIEFDGGEPTLRKDLPELISFAQKAGFKEIIVLTNAVKLSDKNLVKDILNAPKISKDNQGVELGFSVSLHSHKKEISEYLVGTPSTFKKTIRGIQNLLKFGASVSIYHIITKYNFRYLPDFVDFLQTKFPQIRYICFSFIYPRGAALENKHIFAKLSKVEPYLYKALQKVENYGIHFTMATCGTVPLCFLRGYEICTVNQQKLDQPENVKTIDSSQDERYRLATEEFHRKTKIKTPKCGLCLLNSLCIGLWKFYTDIYGTEELKPIVDKLAYKTIEVNLANLENIKKDILNYENIFFVDFKIKKFSDGKIKKAIDFIKWLKEQQLNYLIKKPLPCFLEDCQFLYENLAIPKNCQDCLDLFEVVKDRVYFCNGATGKAFKEYPNREELFIDFKKSKENNKSECYLECYFRKFKANFTNSINPYVYIGYQCNNNCIYCSETDEYMENLKPKSFNQIKEEIKKVRKKYDFINFMGREPTLRKDFLNILKFAQSLSFKQLGFTTNGRMLAYPNFAKSILETGVNQIVISLNGATPEIHDRLSQVSGSFQQTIVGIRNIMKFKKLDVSVIGNLPLNKLNYFGLKSAIELLINLGVKEINVLFISPLSRRSRSKKIVMKMSKLGEYVFNTLEPYLSSSDLKFLLVEFFPCSLPRKARNYFFPCLEKNPHKVRIPICNDCDYKDKCDGILQSYIDLYGIKEFKL